MSNYVLGAGITGLSVALATKWPIFESEKIPGGICSSYYMRAGDKRRFHQVPDNGEAYRFEIGGGHWIFGANDCALSFMHKFTQTKDYMRDSAVCFNKKGLYVPYPIQNNLRFLDKEIVNKVLKKLSGDINGNFSTMKKWLLGNFGTTLCELFFYPFHELYTANLYDKIVPQDSYKSPVDIKLVRQGAKSDTPSAGYNVSFRYPVGGLNTLVQGIEKECDVHYGKRVTRIDIKEKMIYFTDERAVPYNQLISTLPLDKMIEMTGLKVDVQPDPYSSVLVLNIGAVRGDRCPNEHWLYNPDSKSGFHRVGFYSNVDTSFLPRLKQAQQSHVGIYVERAFDGGQKPHDEDIELYIDAVVEELQGWGYIKDVEIVDSTWIDTAYTWSWPNSNWRELSMQVLKENDIYQVGRYGTWKFQGILQSRKDGLEVGGMLS